MPCCFGKPCDAITALFGSAEFIFEERVVLRANYGKIVRHFVWCCKVTELKMEVVACESTDGAPLAAGQFAWQH